MTRCTHTMQATAGKNMSIQQLVQIPAPSRMARPSEACDAHGEFDKGNIALHGYSRVKWGKRRRNR